MELTAGFRPCEKNTACQPAQQRRRLVLHRSLRADILSSERLKLRRKTSSLPLKQHLRYQIQSKRAI